MQRADQLQIIVENLVEVFAFLPRLGKDHGKIEGNRTKIEATLEDGNIRIVGGFHTAAFIPRRKGGATTHQTDRFSVLLIDRRNIAITGQRQIIGIHGFAATVDCDIEQPLVRLPFTVKLFIIQESQFGEEDGFLVAGFALTASADFQSHFRSHQAETRCINAKADSNERIVATAAADSIETILPRLEALLKITAYLFQTISLGIFIGRSNVCNVAIFCNVFVETLFGIRGKNGVDARDCKTTVLASSGGDRDIGDDVKSNVECFRLVVPHVTHLKPIPDDVAHIEQAAVDGIQTCGHIVDVDITILGGVELVLVEEELLVQRLVQLAVDETALRGNESGIAVSVVSVSDIADRLGLFKDIVEHVDEILFIITVITIAFRYARV